MFKHLLLLLFVLSFSLFPSFYSNISVEPIVFPETINEAVYITKTGKKYHKTAVII